MGRVRGNLIGMLVAIPCGLLAACGHSSGDSGATLVRRHAGTGGGAAAAGGNGADAGPSDLVAAVSAAGADTGPVGLKFQVGQRPVAGQPVVVTLRLVANQPLEHLEARFRPDDGLNISVGGDFDPEGPMDAGTTIDHALTLVPSHDGVYTIMATVTTGSAGDAVSHRFVIPIVVPAAPDAGSAPAAKPR
jgi:hypothetical protein